MDRIQESLAAVEAALSRLRADGATEIASLHMQSTGGRRYIVYPRTLAANVDMGDGTDMQTRIRTLERSLAANTSTRVVETLADRDALGGLIPGDRCVVLDATDDPTVERGGAEYIWMPAKGDAAPYWRKLTEEESQDVVILWANIRDKPSQPVDKLDAAALLAHSHANMAVLDRLDRDALGRLTLDGKPVDDGLRDCLSAHQLPDALPDTLRDGGTFILIQE